MISRTLTLLLIVVAPRAQGQEITVADSTALAQALAAAKPGTTIQIAPGTYRGGLNARGIQGEEGRPIIIRAADPKQPPVIEGAGTGLHLADVAHLEIHNLAVQGASGNGINIDDGGSFETPSHHVLLHGLRVREIGPRGNHDGIKLSGLDDFRVEDCIIERWGDGGSGIDMVGCHRGQIVGCTFRHGDQAGADGVQAKGGSSDIEVRRCRFEHAGQRAVNIGGSTGLQFFRPKPQGYEATKITVEDCTFIGSMAPVAFVGVDGSIFRHNTIYRPKRHVLRILQETRQPGFVPSRNGQFTDNLIAFRSDEIAEPVNVGPATAPESFSLARNAWYCLDAPDKSRPKLAVEETNGLYGSDPGFLDPERGDLQLRPDSPARAMGVRPASAESEKGKE
jgi:Right handed beta helix region